MTLDNGIPYCTSLLESRGSRRILVGIRTILISQLYFDCGQNVPTWMGTTGVFIETPPTVSTAWSTGCPDVRFWLRRHNKAYEMVHPCVVTLVRCVFVNKSNMC